MTGGRSGQRGISLVHILLVAVVAGLVAAGAVFFLSSKMQAKAGAPKVKGPKPPPPTVIHDLGDFMVNLSEPGRYLKVSLSVEVEMGGPVKGVESPEKRGEKGEKSRSGGVSKLRSVVNEEFESKTAIARDIIIEQLSSASFHSLLSPQGRGGLKVSIMNGLNASLRKCRVKKVYFTNFTMQ